MVNINISNLSNEIAKQLATYTEDVRQGVVKAIDDSTKDGVKQLQSESPEATGSYRKGWGRIKSKTGTGFIIRNKTDYQLTHLLEYGHAKVGGGRVAARVHIRPVEEKVINDFEEKVRQVIQSK